MSPGQAVPNPNPETPGQGQINPHLSNYQFHFEQGEPGYGGYGHTVTAYGPTGDPHGIMQWHAAHGEITSVETHPSLQGRGLATALWHRAHAISQATRGTPPMQGQGQLFDPGKANRIVPPRHSKYRTVEGNRWAHKVGGYLPPWHRVTMDRRED